MKHIVFLYAHILLFHLFSSGLFTYGYVADFCELYGLDFVNIDISRYD